MRDKQTGELVAVKFIERGEKVWCRSCCSARPSGDYPGFGMFPAVVFVALIDH